MTCTCIDTVLDNIREDVQGKIKPESRESLKVYWSDQGLRLDGKKSYPPLRVSVRYQDFKVNGEPMKRESKTDTNVMINYCPFCGTKLEV